MPVDKPFASAKHIPDFGLGPGAWGLGLRVHSLIGISDLFSVVAKGEWRKGVLHP